MKTILKSQKHNHSNENSVYKFGRYQKRLAVILFLSTIPNSFCGLQFLSIHYTPNFLCRHTHGLMDPKLTISNNSQASQENTPQSTWNSSTWTVAANKINTCTEYEYWTDNLPHGGDIIDDPTLPFPGFLTSNRKEWICYNRILSHHARTATDLHRWGHQSTPTCPNCKNSSQTENRTIGTGTVNNSCTNLVFEGPYLTAPTEFELVCDKAWLKPTMIMIFMIGKMTGSQASGILSDRFGRRIVFLLFSLWQFVATFLLSLAYTIPTYAVTIFLSGSSSVGNFFTATLLGIESVTPRRRKTMYFAIECGFSVGYMILPVFIYYLTDWRWFLRTTSFIGVLYIPLFWIVDESPLWLANNGTPEQAKRLFIKIAKVNNIDAAEEIESLLSKERKVAKANLSHTFQDLAKLCKAPMLVWALTASLFSWLTVALTWNAIALNNNSLSGNRFLNVFYGGLVELASGVLFYLGSATLGGRNSYIILMTIISISVGTVPFIALWSDAAVVVVTMISKLFNAICYNLIFVYTGELFPTSIRQSVTGLVSVGAKVGAMVSPFVIFAGENGNILAPSIIIGVMTLLSAISYCFLPDTTNKPLQNTVEETKSLK